MEKEGLVMIAPYDNLEVITGQGTCALEILEDQPGIETLIVPVGGGGMIAGSSATVMALKPEGVRIVAVEPALSPKLSLALAAGHPVPLDPVDTLADGLVPPAIGQITFQFIRRVVREAVPLSEEEIAAGVRFLFRSLGLRLEPSGATPVAALLTGRLQPTGPTACILTGGNVDPTLFNRLVA